MSTESSNPFEGRRARPHVGDVIARRISRTAIRDCMRAREVGLQKLAERTREVDADKRGVSWQLVAFLASPAPWGRDTTTLASGRLIADALDVPFGELFTEDVVPSRRRQKTPGAA